MSVQKNERGYNPVKLGVKLPDGTTYWLSPQSRKALKAEVDTLAKKIKVDAKALRKALFATIEKEGMDFPSDRNTQETVKMKKAGRLKAMDVALFINSLQGDYNLALASFMEENDEGTQATAKTIQVTSAEGVEYPVMSADLADFAEMRKHGGRYTKAIERSRTDRRKLKTESLEVKMPDGSTHRVPPRKTRTEARRARKAQRVNRRFKSYLERLSRGLISPKPRSQSRALSLSTASTYYRRARRLAKKAYRQVMSQVNELLDNVQAPENLGRYWNKTKLGFDWVGFELRFDRFEELLADLLSSYFKKRKDGSTPRVHKGCKVQAHLAWSNRYQRDLVGQKVQVDLGHIVAKVLN